MTTPTVKRPADDAAYLFALIQEDHRGWQKRAFDTYFDLVRGLLVKALGPLADVDDLLDDVFLRFFESAKRIKAAEGVRSYIVSITMNTVRHEIRRKRRHALVHKLFTDQTELEQRPDVDDPKAKAALIRLSRLLDELSPDERAAFVLRGLEGMQFDEMANALGISISTVKRRVQRATEHITKRVSRDALLADYIRERNGGISEG